MKTQLHILRAQLLPHTKNSKLTSRERETNENVGVDVCSVSDDSSETLGYRMNRVLDVGLGLCDLALRTRREVELQEQ